jgi:heme A synthase
MVVISKVHPLLAIVVMTTNVWAQDVVMTLKDKGGPNIVRVARLIVMVVLNAAAGR